MGPSAVYLHDYMQNMVKRGQTEGGEIYLKLLKWLTKHVILVKKVVCVCGED